MAGKRMRSNQIFSEEMLAWIRSVVKGTSDVELTDMINERYNLNLKISQIRTMKKNHKIRSGRNTKFKKGCASWNKGKKIPMDRITEAFKKTQFKSGNLPHNTLPVGSERLTKDGYIEVKIAMPNVWKGKQIIIWEEHNGPVPDGYVIVFADQNKLNLSIDNLICISRSELVRMNKQGLFSTNPEVTNTGVLIARIMDTAGRRRRKHK